MFLASILGKSDEKKEEIAQEPKKVVKTYDGTANDSALVKLLKTIVATVESTENKLSEQKIAVKQLEKIKNPIKQLLEKLPLFDKGIEPDVAAMLGLRKLAKGININNILTQTVSWSLNQLFDNEELISSILKDCFAKLKIEGINNNTRAKYIEFRSLFLDKLASHEDLDWHSKESREGLERDIKAYQLTVDNLPEDKELNTKKVIDFLRDDLKTFFINNNILPYSFEITHPSLYLFAQDLVLIVKNKELALPSFNEMVDSFLRPEALQQRPFSRLLESEDSNPYIYMIESKKYNLETLYKEYKLILQKTLEKGMSDWVKNNVRALESTAIALIDQNAQNDLRYLNEGYRALSAPTTITEIKNFKARIDEVQQRYNDLKSMTFKQLMEVFKPWQEVSETADYFQTACCLAMPNIIENSQQGDYLNSPLSPTIALHFNEPHIAGLTSGFYLETKRLKKSLQIEELKNDVPKAVEHDEKEDLTQAMIFNNKGTINLPELVTIEDMIANPAPQLPEYAGRLNREEVMLPSAPTLEEHDQSDVTESVQPPEPTEVVPDYSVITLEDMIVSSGITGSTKFPLSGPSQLFKGLTALPQVQVQTLTEPEQAISEAELEQTEQSITAKNLDIALSIKSLDGIVSSTDFNTLFKKAVAYSAKLNALFTQCNKQFITEHPATLVGELQVDLENFTEQLELKLYKSIESSILEDIQSNLFVLQDSIDKLKVWESQQQAVANMFIKFNTECQELKNNIANGLSRENLHQIKSNIKNVAMLRTACIKASTHSGIPFKDDHSTEITDSLIIKIAEFYKSIELSTSSYLLQVGIKSHASLNLETKLSEMEECIRQLEKIDSELATGFRYCMLLSEFDISPAVTWNKTYRADYLSKVSEFIDNSSKLLSNLNQFLQEDSRVNPVLPATVTSLIDAINWFKMWEKDFNAVKAKINLIKSKNYSMAELSAKMDDFETTFNNKRDVLTKELDKVLTATEDALSSEIRSELDISTFPKCIATYEQSWKSANNRLNDREKYRLLQSVINSSSLKDQTAEGKATTLSKRLGTIFDDSKICLQKFQNRIDMLFPIKERAKKAIAITDKLDEYVVKRGEKYNIKDVFSNDGDERKKFIIEIKAQLKSYVENGDLAVIQTIKDNHHKYPGMKLQPLLNRIVHLVEDVDSLKPNKDIVSKVEAKIGKLGMPLNNLQASIAKMNRYGDKLSGQDKEYVYALSGQLANRLANFLDEHHMKILAGEWLSKEDVAKFKEEMKTLLHSQDDRFSNHHDWGRVVGNVLIGVASLGTLLIGSLVCTKYFGSGRAHLFFDKTTRQENVDVVEERVNEFIAAVAPSA